MPTNSKDYVEVNVGRWVVYGILAVILLIILFGSFYTIQPGERGVLITFGKPSMEAVGEGLHFKYPIAQTVKKLNVKTVKIEEVADAASKDLQDVQISVTLNYHIMPSLAPKLYQEVGKTYEDTVIRPAIQDSIKATSALYNAENQLIKRPEIRQGVKEDLQARLEQFHIVVDDVSITNFQFSEQFDNAIEAKQVAEQDAQRAERELTKVKLEAEQKIALANAEAESLRLQKNEITPTLLQLRAIEVEKIKWERWNGQLPTTVLGDSSGVLPFYNVNNVAPV